MLLIQALEKHPLQVQGFIVIQLVSTEILYFNLNSESPLLDVLNSVLDLEGRQGQELELFGMFPGDKALAPLNSVLFGVLLLGEVDLFLASNELIQLVFEVVGCIHDVHHQTINSNYHINNYLLYIPFVVSLEIEGKADTTFGV